jgi:hypothetical protein
MNNNRKQKVYSLLDSLSQNELEKYMSERDFINADIKRKFAKIKNSREPNHYDILTSKIGVDIDKNFKSFYKIGQAWIIAFVLECFYDKKYKIADLKEYLKALIDDDKELKEYVYDLMKDF